jgi:hypothetical protein
MTHSSKVRVEPYPSSQRGVPKIWNVTNEPSLKLKHDETKNEPDVRG